MHLSSLARWKCIFSNISLFYSHDYHKATIFQLCITVLYIFNIILIEKPVTLSYALYTGKL